MIESRCRPSGVAFGDPGLRGGRSFSIDLRREGQGGNLRAAFLSEEKRQIPVPEIRVVSQFQILHRREIILSQEGGDLMASKRSKEPTYGEWLSEELEKADMGVLTLAERSGLSPPAIYNVLNGNTLNPQKSTREKIEKALKAKPEKALEESIAAESNVVGLGKLEEFFPHDLAEAPEVKGIYVFYDTFEKPVYVGKAVRQTIRKRVEQHRDKFWFRDPIVSKARFIEINDASLCGKIEVLLIKFLGSHNLLNKKGAETYKPEDFDQDT